MHFNLGANVLHPFYSGRGGPMPILWGSNVFSCHFSSEGKCSNVCVGGGGGGGGGGYGTVRTKKKQFLLGRFSQSDFFYRAPNESVKSTKPGRRDHHQSCQLCCCEKKKKKKRIKKR